MSIATVSVICEHGVNHFRSECGICQEMNDQRMHAAGRQAAERQHAAIIAAIAGKPQCRCQPTIEHSFSTRQSRARCWRCGATIPPIDWGADFPPRDMNERCINAFREEHHHAD